MLNRAVLFSAIEAGTALADGGTLGLLVLRSQRLREVERQVGYAGAEAYVDALEASLRGALREGDSVVRIGEADFAAVLPCLRGRNHVALAAGKVVRSLQAVELGGRVLEPAFALGAVAWPDDGGDAAALCRAADAACSAAAGSAERYVLGAPARVAVAYSHEELRDAIAANQLQLHLQPIVPLCGGTPRCEALSRWRHPAHGDIPPSDFIAVAEETGLIGALTRWSFNAALRHLLVARRNGAPLGVSINLAADALQQGGFVEQVGDLLKFWGVPPEAVLLEVTETGLMRDLSASARALSRLRDLGVGIAIDDFGTGYSSMAYLRQLPATELKIDRSFVRDMVHDARVRKLVGSMIDLSHHLGLEVVAEGVEDAEALALLDAMGCDFAQGYHLGRPQPAEDLIARVCAEAALAPPAD